MELIENLLSRIRSIPEAFRSPQISNREIEDITRNMLLINECNNIRNLGVRW